MEKEISEDSYCTTDEGEDKSTIINLNSLKKLSNNLLKK
jgi:hypothetical protein